MPTIKINWADNTAELRANLAKGIDQIEATHAAAEKMAKALGGENLIRAAHNYVAAVQQVGGANKLTAEWQEKVNNTVTKAIAQYTAMGKVAPAAMLALADATKKTEEPTAGLALHLSAAGKEALTMAAGFFTAQAALAAVKGGINALGTEVENLVMNGSAVSDVTANFQRMTEQTGRLGSTLLGALRDGTHATIDDFALMKLANQDLAAGMKLTDQQFGTLAKGAFALAQATGTDVKTALDTMNDAMLTGRTKALAMLTGKIDLTAAEEKFAKSIGSTAEHLNAEGKLEAARVAILNGVSAATDRLGEQIDGLDENVAQVQVTWANFHNELAKTVAESPVLAEAFNGVKDAIAGAVGADQQTLIKAIAERIDDATIALMDLARVGVDAGSFLAVEAIAVAKVYGDVVQAISLVAMAFKGASLAAAEFLSIGGHVGPLKDDVGRIRQEMVDLKVAIRERGKALQEDDAAQESVRASSQKLTEALNGLQSKMRAAKETSAAFVGPLQETAAAHTAAADAAGKQAQYTQRTKEEISKATGAVEKWNAANANLQALMDGQNWDGTIEGALRLGASVSDLATWYGVATGEIERAKREMELFGRVSQDTLEATEGAWKAWVATQKKLADEADAAYMKNNEIAVEAARATADAMAKASMTSFDYQRRQVLEWQDTMEGAIDYTQDNWAEAFNAIAVQAKEKLDEIAAASELEDVKIKYEFVGPVSGGSAAGKTFGEEIKAGFGDAVKDIPQILIHAFEGGGNLLGALKAIGVKVADAIVTPILDGIETATAKMKALAAGVAGAMAGVGTMASGGSARSAAGNTAMASAGVATAAVASGATIAGAVALGAATFGIGLAAVGAYIALKKLFGLSREEQEGRAVVADFEKQFSSTTDMINKVGAAYIGNGKSAEQAQAAIQRMWAAEKLGAEATKKALEEINEELKRHGEITDAIHSEGFQSQDEIRHAADIANAAYEEMLRSGQYTAEQVDKAYRHYQELLAQLEGAAGEAARAWLKAHQAADAAAEASSDAMKSAEADLKALVDKRNALAQGIAAEAPEQVMGVIEEQQRGQLAVLDKEIQDKADAYAKLADETGQKMADAIVEALRNIHIDPVHVPVQVDTPDTSKFPRDFPNTGGRQPETFDGEVPEPASTGGRVLASGIQHFAIGGPVLPSFRPIGTDIVPAMLTPGELVLTASQQAAIGTLLSRAQVSTSTHSQENVSVTNVTIHATDAQSFERLIRERGVKVVVDTIVFGKDGHREILKRAVR